MSIPFVTLTTDFGAGSTYVAQMKGVILSICPAVHIVDLSHDIGPQDVRQGAILLADATPLFPCGTLHVAVIDPGVGSKRHIVYARAGGQAYIAPDNGLLSRVAQRCEPDLIIALENPEYWRPHVSSTFHGRDIMAPAAAHLCRGTPPGELGPPRQYLTQLPWPAVIVDSHRIQGSVLQIDSFGNVISDITREHLAVSPSDRRLRVACRGYVTEELVDHYDQQPPGTLVALFGSSDRLELSVCQSSAAERLGAAVGDPIEVAW
jgi:S-adenosylmethionine hydrolase